MAGSETMAVVIRAWQANARGRQTVDQIPSGHFLTGIHLACTTLDFILAMN